MISLILLVQYLVEALNEPRVQPEEDNPESNATGRAKCGQSGEGNPDRHLPRAHDIWLTVAIKNYCAHT
jgi:hypothetical protein